jgi:ABC-type Zn uptake system ZnuABC Zn-binding protein ZnuA
MLTPRLVRLDPDHQEVYLDNEIALIAQLKGLEQEISGILSPYEVGPVFAVPGVDQYFKHRYLASSTAVDESLGDVYKVSSNPVTTCSHTDNIAHMATPGPDYYFTTMRQTARTVAGCLRQADNRKTATNLRGVLNRES